MIIVYTHGWSFTKPPKPLMDWQMALTRTAQAELGFPGWLRDKEFPCQCRRCGFQLWVRKNSWRRKWQPTPVFLPGKSHRRGVFADYSPWRDWSQSDLGRWMPLPQTWLGSWLWDLQTPNGLIPLKCILMIPLLLWNPKHPSEIYMKFVLLLKKVSTFINFKFPSDKIANHICSEAW